MRAAIAEPVEHIAVLTDVLILSNARLLQEFPGRQHAGLQALGLFGHPLRVVASARPGELRPGTVRPGSAPCVAVLGGCGGAGASTLAAGLARSALQAGRAVVLIDGDPLGGGLETILADDLTADRARSALSQLSGG